MDISKVWMVLLIVLLTPAAPGLAGRALAESCPSASARFDAARAAGDTELAIRIHGELPETDPACSEEVLFCAGNAIALDLLRASYAVQERPMEAAILLERASDFGAPWQVLVGLADRQFARGQQRKDGAAFDEAATLYQEALNQLAEAPVCGGSQPTEAQIAPIFTRMTEAVLLAPRFNVVRTRSGRCGGIFLASVRGFAPRFRPIPINFEFAKGDFTVSGSTAAEVLLSCLLEAGTRGIVLSGHTDPVGSDAFNMNLSRQRLDRVAEYLRDGGFEGEIALQPMGESEPFEPDDPGAYSESEQHQLDRRVVLRDWLK
jgi:outer membrane protein OmpA-like peptidoglycan-associated protein